MLIAVNADFYVAPWSSSGNILLLLSQRVEKYKNKRLISHFNTLLLSNNDKKFAAAFAEHEFKLN